MKREKYLQAKSIEDAIQSLEEKNDTLISAFHILEDGQQTAADIQKFVKVLMKSSHSRTVLYCVIEAVIKENNERIDKLVKEFEDL